MEKRYSGTGKNGLLQPLYLSICVNPTLNGDFYIISSCTVTFEIITFGKAAVEPRSKADRTGALRISSLTGIPAVPPLS
ncbi:MAG: hypothetical protein GVY08_05270 [Bacteroidetes bacterium]|nr:hypothetical protein [Bacteroidota bacterium]